MRKERSRIPVKNPEELRRMREACRLAAVVIEAVVREVRAGVTTGELDTLAERLIVGGGGRPAFKGYRGYPCSTCISVNEELIHGIPGRRVIRPGDVVSIDLGVEVAGMMGDVARTVGVKPVRGDVARMVMTVEEAFREACKVIRAGARVGDISAAVQRLCEGRGYGVIREYVGHGIGRELHEAPQIPNVGEAGTGPELPEGATLAIEPMISLGGHRVKVLEDRWTVVTEDGAICAHYENTVLVTKTGCEILTVAA
ncbi:MAG: type I methionyl aminopeptidase [bacterium]|nr:type I methionyl aminopeptidase [bacterium]